MKEKKAAGKGQEKTGSKRKLSVTRTQWLQYGLAVLLVFFLAFILEYLCQMPVLRSDNRGVLKVPMEMVAADGFERTEEGFLLTEDRGTLSIGLDGIYVDRFIYHFDYDHLLNAKVYVCFYNAYGEADPDQDMILEDRNARRLETSSLKIGKNVDSIVLAVERPALGEEGTRAEAAEMPLTITGFEVADVPEINLYRLGSFLVILGLAAYFWFCRGYLGKHLEAAFLAVCLSVGTLTICALPAGKVGFDEETHLYRAMGIASFPHGMNINQPVFSQMIADLDSWPENQPGSYMEQTALREYLDEMGDYRTGTIHLEPIIPAGTIPAYLGQALVLKLCKGFHVPWGYMLMLGRFGNLLVYAALMYLAIKKTPVGKAVMLVIGLMPTSMFLACTYSYDPWVTGWIYLGTACLLKEVLTPEEKITWKSYLQIMTCFLLGCAPKAVYAPMVLIALLLPAKKFRERKERYLMRAGICLLLAGLLASFILPVLIAPSQTGDIRGGATSEAGQMSYVLGHLPGYLQVLSTSIIRSMPQMLFGRDIFSVQGHLADSPFTWLSMGLALYVVVTDTKATSPETLKAGQKLWIFLMLGGSVLLIWTSMYIAYTVPGSLTIAGVQGRYHLPVLYLFYMLFNSRMIIARTKNMWYHTGVSAVSAGLLLATFWVTVLLPMCM